MLVPTTLHVAENFCLYVAASAETHHEIISAREDGMKRHAKPDFEDDHVVKTLYRLYQGGSSGRSPGSVALKAKVLNFMLKSAKATNEFPAMIQVAFDALFGIFFIISYNICRIYIFNIYVCIFFYYSCWDESEASIIWHGICAVDCAHGNIVFTFIFFQLIPFTILLSINNRPM